MEILKVENLCKRYGEKDTEVVALDSVSFSVEKGEFVAIIGASGSGKSTLLHLIGGVDRPTSGKVFIDMVQYFKSATMASGEFRTALANLKGAASTAVAPLIRKCLIRNIIRQ